MNIINLCGVMTWIRVSPQRLTCPYMEIFEGPWIVGGNAGLRRVILEFKVCDN